MPVYGKKFYQKFLKEKRIFVSYGHDKYSIVAQNNFVRFAGSSPVKATTYLPYFDNYVMEFDTLEECNVVNHIRVPENIMEQFMGVLNYELDMLREEFKAL